MCLAQWAWRNMTALDLCRLLEQLQPWKTRDRLLMTVSYATWQIAQLPSNFCGFVDNLKSLSGLENSFQVQPSKAQQPEKRWEKAHLKWHDETSSEEVYDSWDGKKKRRLPRWSILDCRWVSHDKFPTVGKYRTDGDLDHPRTDETTHPANLLLSPGKHVPCTVKRSRISLQAHSSTMQRCE